MDHLGHLLSGLNTAGFPGVNPMGESMESHLKALVRGWNHLAVGVFHLPLARAGEFSDRTSLVLLPEQWAAKAPA
jgi:hypothetical protein